MKKIQRGYIKSQLITVAVFAVARLIYQWKLPKYLCLTANWGNNLKTS